MEFAVFRAWPEVVSGKIVVAVSGGLDSLVLAQILARVAPRKGAAIEIAHVHHGKASSEKQQRYRDRAAKFVARFAEELGVPFHLLRASVKGDSEEALRDARFAALENMRAQSAAEFVALAHHSDDLFETRLIRLMRGTGPDGLQSMTEIAPPLWRPLLLHSRAEMEAYWGKVNSVRSQNRAKKWKPIADPSNREPRYLRNRVRRELIPLFEELRKGSAQSFARSLDLLVSEISQTKDFASDDSLGKMPLNRKSWLALPSGERLQQLARWLRAQGLRNVSKSQLEEVAKRIDTPRRRLKFEVCGRLWLIDDEIKLSTP